MSDEVLEKMISTFMKSNQSNYAFGWQGGEPTLMGVDFYRKVVDLQQKYGNRGALVSNGLQTNVTLIDDEFAAHLAKYQFLVGASIDGPPNLHDTYRRNAAGRGSFAAVERGIEALNSQGVEYNALILVSSANVNHPEEVYRYLCDHDILFHQYIPCVEFDNTGNPLPYTISAEEWGNFLKAIYDLWKGKDTRRVSIRDFDAIIQHMVAGTYGMCVHAGYCAHYLVVEHNGDIYPCDFFVEKSKKLGSIMSNTWRELRTSSKYHAFAKQKAEWNTACSECKFLRYCSGDCLKQRFYGSANPQNLSWLCNGWKSFYAHAIPGFEQLAVSLINEGRVSGEHKVPTDRIPKIRMGWNDPCYCGSGKKYRLCHGTADSMRRSN